ncbi:MAG TPA: hypothetical protein DCE33_11835, partial [Rhodospirillaceae bacterium]|nr:hypothetical protein [Rhodospirillaceae bacterium]
MRGADLIARALERADVKDVFALSGNQIMPIFDACIDAEIALYHVRHEAAATYMADCWAQLTGKVGVALVTAAPGFANALSPLYSAGMAESPVLLLSGDSPRAADGKGSFQEMDQVTASTPFTKHSFRSETAEGLGQDIADAIHIACSGRPGPVHLALPFDLLNTDVGDVALPSDDSYQPLRKAPSPAMLDAIAETLKVAEKPLLITGPRLNRTRAEISIDSLADAIDVPVIPMESPRGLNDPALGDFSEMFKQADLVLSLGKRLDFTTGFAQSPAIDENCRFIIADPDVSELSRARRALGARLHAAYVADPELLGQALCDLQSATDRRAWRADVSAAISARGNTPEDASTPIHPAKLGAAVQEVIDQADDPILIVDGGEFGQWAQATISAPTRVINGPGGAIGGGLCYAFAAKIARPEATVIVLMGDGTAGFHFAEFETAQRYGTNFIAVIGNDARWNAEYQIQLRDYGDQRLYGCELNPTQY